MAQKAPEARTVESLFEELVRSRLHLFPQRARDLDAPKARGVYVIYDRKRRPVHVGRTPNAKGGLRQRLGNHMQNQSSFTEHYLKGDGGKLARHKYKFRCISVPRRRQRALLEFYAIGHLCPVHLGLG